MEASLPWPQLLDSEPRGPAKWAFLIAGPEKTLDAISRMANGRPRLDVEARGLSSVTATCQGAFASDLPLKLASVLAREGIAVQKLLFGAMSVTAIVSAADRIPAERAMHGCSP